MMEYHNWRYHKNLRKLFTAAPIVGFSAFLIVFAVFTLVHLAIIYNFVISDGQEEDIKSSKDKEGARKKDQPIRVEI